MTSKIVVNNIESDSGISSVTFTSDIELGTKNLKGHNLESTGIVTAVSFTGSGANLTSIPAGNLTGTLPALDGSALTGVGVGTDGSINTSGIVTATTFVPTVGQLSHRNIIVNGDMTIAQRGSTSTSQGYQTVDRFAAYFYGTDEAPTQSTFDVSPPSSPYHLPTSGAHPYKEGFRKAFGVTNGNQTGGAGAGDYVYIRYKVEAQDLANSGWDSTSASSYLTLSFWVKSSVAQNFNCRLESQDGTKRNYPFETGSLSAFTWTKITKTIPGNTSPTVDIDNNNGTGIEIHWQMFRGTDFTDNSVSNDTWATYASGTRTKDATSTWYTTNDASFQITGVQLEVGPVATPFEHRSYGEELMRCMRYCQVYVNPKLRGVRGSNAADFHRMGMTLLNTMRADPTATWSGNQSVYDGSGTATITGISSPYVDTVSFEMDSSASGSLTVGTGSAVIAYTGGNEATLTLSAEL